MASLGRIRAARLAIHLEVTWGMIFSLKDYLIGRSRGSIIDYLFRAEVRVNQSMEHHLRDGRSGDCMSRLILYESKRTATDIALPKLEEI
jgi:hypothetical protein